MSTHDIQEVAVTAEPPLTDVGNAQRLVKRFGDRIRYHANANRWMRWNGRHWEEDHTLALERMAKRVARDFFRAAAKLEGPALQAMLRHAQYSERSVGIQAMLRMARSEPGISITANDLDADPWLLNVQNATIELKTGKPLTHEPSRLITKLAPVDFDHAAECPRWIKFLDRTMNGDQDMIGYLQRIAGLCLTGDIAVQELFICHGGGANGKSVFFDTLTALLGDYAGLAPESLVTIRTHNEHPTEIAGLVGKRMVIASELEEGARLRVALVKRLTGDEQLTGRFMRQDFFNFNRTHKLIIVSNSKPQIREKSDAIWRRVRLVPFSVTIPEGERDPGLIETLRSERSGILNWAIRGCLEWQQRKSMSPPQAVIVASADYKKEQDVLAEFLEDCCVVGSNGKATRNDLYSAYQSWAVQTREEHPLDRTSFYGHIRSVPGVREHEWRPVGCTVPARGFIGISLVGVAM